MIADSTHPRLADGNHMVGTTIAKQHLIRDAVALVYCVQEIRQICDRLPKQYRRFWQTIGNVATCESHLRDVMPSLSHTPRQRRKEGGADALEE